MATTEQAVVAAAREFVSSTSYFRQRKESRESFERLALALVDYFDCGPWPKTMEEGHKDTELTCRCIPGRQHTCGKPNTVESFPGDSRLFEGPDGVEISIITRVDHAEAHCHGPVEHFRDDGGCEHLDQLLAVQKPGRDVRILPFGGRTL